MINIKVLKKDYISKVTITGHSGYSEEGTDIVCASVSSIAITTLNASIKVASDIVKFKSNDGFLEMEILEHNRIVEILINNMLDLLKELKEQYPQNIKITEVL